MKELIVNEVNNSKWQPTFRYTDNLEFVVDEMLKPHEDYELRLHSEIINIINEEIEFVDNIDVYSVEFAVASAYQKRLFTHKKERIDNCYGTSLEDYVNKLPSKYIQLGLRNTDVVVGAWIPPNPIHLEELKSMCFPIHLDCDCRTAFSLDYTWQININDTCLVSDELNFEIKLLNELTKWYKTFQTIHFFNDLNGRIGGIIINIIAYTLTGKYITKYY